MKNRILIFSILFIFNLVLGAEDLITPPIAPTVTEDNSTDINSSDTNLTLPTAPDMPNIVEDNRTIDSNVSIPVSPQVPNITENNSSDTNLSIPINPQIPSITENNISDLNILIPRIPITPFIKDNFMDLNFSIPVTPQNPISDIKFPIPKAPEMPHLFENENRTIPISPTVPNDIIKIENNISIIPIIPISPELNQENINPNLTPQIPQIGNSDIIIVKPPENPNIGETDYLINNPPENPMISNIETLIIQAPTTPDIINPAILIPETPLTPQEIAIKNNYVIGKILLPKNILDSNFEISFVSFTGVRNSSFVDEQGFWAIKFPLLADDKEFFIELIANQNGIITKYFIDGETLEITLDNQTPKVLNKEFGTFVPDISPILVTSSTDNIGEINLVELEKEFSIIQGYIISDTDNDFSFSAIDIDTGEIVNFDNSNLGFSKFGFKINRNNQYLLQLSIEDEEYFVNYKNGTQEIDIFAKNELDLNLSGIPTFDNYIEPIEDMNFSINYLDYLNSIYKVSGKVKVSEDENLTLTVLDSENGKFLDEVILNNENEYSFSVILGRDFKDKSILFYLTKTSNPTTHYIYDSVTKSFKQFQDSDFVETENGLLPNLDIFTPFKVLATKINLDLDFSSLKTYEIFGKVNIPDNLQIGEVCQTEENITKYNSECNSSMETIGFNFISLIFTDLDTNISKTVNLDNLGYIFETDNARNFSIDLELSTFDELANQTITQNFAIAKNIELTDYNKSINFDINLNSKLNSQFAISGDIQIDNSITQVQITFLDSEIQNILGFSDSLNKYSVNLDKFSDENISNNDILMEIHILKNDKDQTFFFDGVKLIPAENTNYIKSGQEWIIDKNSSGFISLEDVKHFYNFDLDLPTLISNFENNLFRLSGNIKFGKSFDKNSSILIELINKTDRKVVKPIFYNSDRNNSDFFFELKVENSGEYAISIVLENQNFIYNPQTKKLFDMNLIDFDREYISFDNSHKDIILDINPDEILNSGLKISGKISDLSNATISAYDINGNLLGNGEILSDGNYSILLQNSQVSDEIYLKIQLDSDSYFVGSNNILVESSSVIETETSFDLGLNIQPIILKEDLSQNLSFQELLDTLDKDKYRIYGDIIGLDGNLSFQIIDVNNHKYFESVNIIENNFSIDLPNGGEFMLYISTDSQDMFYDFNNSKFISANNINFVKVDSDWLPNWKETGSILLNTLIRKKKVDIDFSNLENSFITLSGEIILPSQFLLGETCKIGEEIETDNNCDSTYSNYQFLSLKSAFISIVDRATKEEIAFYPIENQNQAVGNNIKYFFSIDIENKNSVTQDLIFNIFLQEKDSETTKNYQLIYDFEKNEIINSKIDSNQSWISVSTSQNDISLDLSTFLTSQKKIILKLQTPTNFILENNNSALISLYDYETGEYLDSIKTYSDKNITFEVGSKNGKYLFEIQLQNQEYSETFYLDFGTAHNLDNLTVLKSDEVQWIEKNGNIIPNINYLELNKTEIFSATIQNSSGFDFSGSVTSDIEMKTIDIMLTDYNTNISYFETVRNGNFEFHNIKNGNYSISILAKDLDNNFFQIFISDTGFVNNFDLIWKPNSRENNSTFYYPSNTKQFEISSSFTENINLGDFLKVPDRYSLNIKANTKIQSAELFIPNSSINYFVNANSFDMNFSNISPKDGYYLNFQIDGKQYYFNSETEELVSGVNWNAYKNDVKVCPTETDNWDCEWGDSANWIWKPNVPAYNLANISDNVNLEINLPQESQISGIVKFGNDFANDKFYVVAYQLDSSIYQEKIFQTDENGDLNISLKAIPIDNYRLEILNSKMHYVLNHDGNYELIFNSNSWKSDVFGAKETTLINMTDDLDFGNIVVPTLNRINFNIENLDNEESVFVIIFDNENYFYNDNLENANQVSFVAKSGLYKIAIFSSKHDSGYAISENGENNFTKFGWDWSSALDISVNQDSNYTISFSSNEDLRFVSGQVNLGGGNIEKGWIEIFNDEVRKGVEVAKNGKYKIEGLKPSADYNFSLEYRSWEFDNIVLAKDLGVWTSGNLENQDISQDSYSYTITGKIEYLGSETIKMKAMLIKYNKRKNSWKVGRKTKLDENSEFKFEKLQPNLNIIYYVCAGVKVSDSSGTHYTRFNATKGDENLSDIDTNSSIQISNFQKVSN